MVAGALNFTEAPLPLTRRERFLFAAVAIVVGLTRLLARSQTLWDWDEALFGLALRGYDVVAHHPQPPGFPLFIGLARLLPLAGFPALQSIALVSSLFVFPAMFFLARELKAGFFTSVASGLLLALFPNVWFFGGTAFSDVPSMVLSLTASLLLLRGCRDDRAMIAGALLLGVAAGFRPQNLLIGFAPAMLALRHRRRAAIVGAILGAAIIGGSYGAAAWLSGGWEAYRTAVATHAEYIRMTDSFLSATRPGLVQVADDFFLRPWRAPLLNVAVVILAAIGLAIGLVTRRRSVLVALAIFGPFTIFAWLYLDFHSASRFSIAYMPLFAICAAEGIASAGRRNRVALLTLIVAALAVWTLPSLNVVRRTPSPPVAAVEAIRSMDPATTIVWVDDRLAAHAAFLLPGYERHSAGNAPPIVGASRAGVILLREGASNAPGARTFSRARERLDGIVRPRYFATSIVPAPRVAFVDGWFAEEGPVRTPWRWMGTRGTILLPEGNRGGELTLRASTPRDARVIVRLDGTVLGIIDARRGSFAARWKIAPGRELTIETTDAVVVADDPRLLGLRLDALELLFR